MTNLELRIFPDPILKEKSKEVDIVDSKIQKLMDDMLEAMYNERGVGLAAVLTGHLKRILVMDVSYGIEKCGDGGCHDIHVTDKNPIFMVNPKIISTSKKQNSFSEGCLSFPEIRAEIKRPEIVEIEYLDYNGKKQILEADGLLSTCVQHEIDHLNGITFIDYLSKIKRDMLLKKMYKKFKQ